MERRSHINLDPEVRERLLTANAATLDGVLKPTSATVASRRKRRRIPQRGHHIPVRTFAYWNKLAPGFPKIDLVAYCGDNMDGSCVYSLVAIDICAGWTEAVPLLARKQSSVMAG